jgi:ribosomal protein S18 acetylase RimI-like enzyme
MITRQPAALLRVVGATLVLGSLALMLLYTALTLREVRLIEAAFGEQATGAGRAGLVPQLLVVHALGLAGVVVGAALLRVAGRRRRVTVRPVRSEEHDTAAAVVLRAYRELMGDELGEEYAAVLGDISDRAGKAEVLVATDGDALLGCVTYVPGPGPYAEFDDRDAAGIRMLAVAPSAQGRGIGASLVRECLRRAEEAGRARVVLHSTPKMAAAQRLYAREGFQRATERDWEPSPGVHLLGFERPVAS